MIRTLLQYGIIALVFFFLALVQLNFLPYFAVAQTTPNIIFILFFLLLFFEKKHDYLQGFLAAIIAGFFMDLYSPFPFGVSIFSLLALCFLDKGVHYFIKEGQQKNLIIYVAVLFFAYGIVQAAIMFLFSLIFGTASNFGLQTIIELVYGLPFLAIGIFIGRRFFAQSADNNQLKLFN